MIGRRRSVLPGGVTTASQEPPPWRLLTLDDLGTPVGAPGWSIAESGDPALPMRITSPDLSGGGSTTGLWVLPIVGISGLIPAGRGIIYGRMAAATGAGQSTLIGLGTWDPDTPASGGTVATTMGAGLACSVASAQKAYRTRGSNAIGGLGTGIGPDWRSADGIARVDVLWYGYATGASGSRRSAEAHLVREDGSAVITSASDATGSYHHGAASSGVGDSDGPAVICGQDAGAPSRTVDVAIYVLTTPAPPRG